MICAPKVRLSERFLCIMENELIKNIAQSSRYVVIMNMCEYEFGSYRKQCEKYFRYCSITQKTVEKNRKIRYN